MLTVLQCAAFTALAQEPAKNLQLDEMVVTGQYEANSLTKSVVKVKVIDARRIAAQGAFNLQQVLGNELNIRLVQDPVLGSSMQLQGVGGNNIKILIDGVPVVGRENGNIDLQQINLQSIERIEFVEGPMSVNYGTDALGGVINLITKKQKKDSWNARLGGYAESVGQYNTDVGAGYGGKKYGVSGNAGRNFFAGFSPVEDSRSKLWKPRTQYQGDLTFHRYHSGGGMRLTQQLFHEVVSDRGEPTVDWSQASALDRYYTTLRSTTSFFYDRKFEGKRTVSLVASYNYYRRSMNTYRKDLVALTQELVPTASDQDTTAFHQWMSRGTYANVAFSSKLAYQMGYELNHERSVGSRINGNVRELGDYNAFFSTEVKPFKRMLIRPAMRVTWHTRYAAPLIPSLHLKYDFTDLIQLRASYARGFRAPSLKELFLDFVDVSHNLKGNPSLQAETSDNLQAGITFDRKSENKSLRFDPGVFYNHIHNMIDLVRVGSGTAQYFQYLNVNAFSSVGVNLLAEYRTPSFQVMAGYGYTGRQYDLSGYGTSAKIFWSNDMRLNLSWQHQRTGWSANLFTKWNGRLQQYQYSYLTDQATIGYIDPFALVDVSAGKTFMQKKLSVTAGVKNLLNVVNVNASLLTNPHAGPSGAAAAAMGRNAFMGVRYIIGGN